MKMTQTKCLSTLDQNITLLIRLTKSLKILDLKHFQIFHCNARSLPRNLTLLNDMIYTLSSKPDVLAITETKLNEKTVSNVDISGYNFYHVDSLTAAGGTGIYVNRNLKTINRPDIKLSMDLVESCWVEIKSAHSGSKNTIIGCIYRHPKGNLDKFAVQLDELLQYLNQSKYQVILVGDFNIDLFQIITHQSTERYLDMLFSNNFFPLITKPTRITNHSKTLIDHIYVNMPTHQMLSGIALFDISDHLPIFCVISMTSKKLNEKVFYRDYKQFNKEDYLQDLTRIDWNAKLNNVNNNINETTNDVIKTIEEISNKHAPVKEVPRSKLKQFTKPWITNGILKSIKTKQKMYYTHFLSNENNKIKLYKIYSNKLNKIK